MIVYFAYGSNLDKEQMQNRCPSSCFLCKALLENYKLAFTRKSTKRGGGVADIVESVGSRVWGVVYQLDERELESLDKREGYDPNRKKNMEKNCYIRKELTVCMDGYERKQIMAYAYQVQEPSSSHIPPSRKYLNQIISAAEFWGIDPEYIEELKSISVSCD
jgi:gamma-glutamylcyclotransferase